MNLKGEISVIKNDKAKVFIREKGLLTNLLDVAEHVGPLKTNDKVVVSFYGNTFTDGIISAKVKEG
ncbi:hypothetical protein PBV87_12925 [Niameybacter massiliensis]|uniref:Uncharacterized protein n=1 Tax=Holtiella tumoricola TaxID=3018743 RepID=A0AA42J1C8_9FIRM|nr:hypothetical protein [Holtiella tumoricola]MDA3732392.1 hypothetical protein [Holtiella tumoricola]